MRIVSIESDKQEIEFARKATEYFQKNSWSYTYVDGNPKPGELFAIRWNPYTVLIIKLDDTHDPACYSTNSFIGCDLPKLEPKM